MISQIDRGALRLKPLEATVSDMGSLQNCCAKYRGLHRALSSSMQLDHIGSSYSNSRFAALSCQRFQSIHLHRCSDLRSHDVNPSC